jgi:hypothetical protein
MASRAEAIGKALGSAVDTWNATGEHPASSQQTRDLLIRAFAPRTIYKTIASFEDEHMKSLTTGSPLIKDLGFGSKMLYAAGIPTDTIARNFSISDILWREKEARIAEVQKLGQLFMEAQEKRDHAAMKLILTKAQLQGISSSVLKSANSRAADKQQDSLERNFGADTLLRFRKLVGQ